MPRKFKPGDKAHHNNRELRFSHIPINAGDSLVLTADPWSFMRNHLVNLSKKRGEQKKNAERAQKYLSLAEDFYKSSEAIHLPTKATLIYYGMMNLVKVLLCSNSEYGKKFESKKLSEHHGLCLSSDKEIKIIEGNNVLSIFKYFAVDRGAKKDFKEHTLSLSDVLINIVDIENIYSNVPAVSARKELKYLPIDISFYTSEGEKSLFTEISYEKKHEKCCSAKKFLSGKRENYFTNLNEKNCHKEDVYEKYIVYRGKKKRTGKRGNFETQYKNTLKDYTQFNICSLLTRQGYNYYCDLSPGDYHHLCYTYMAMYYLGTAARYRPTELGEVMKGELRPLITEAVAICPKQFLYQMAGFITERMCVIPYSKI